MKRNDPFVVSCPGCGGAGKFRIGDEVCVCCGRKGISCSKCWGSGRVPCKVRFEICDICEGTKRVTVRIVRKKR